MNRVLPILFNGKMVRAILEGRKTATRRAVRYKYGNTEIKMKTDKYGTGLIEIQKDVEGETHGKNPDGSTWHKLRPYIEKRPPYRPGDILYVRETWAFAPCIKCNMGELISRRCGEDPIEYGDGGSMSEGCFVYRAGHTEPRRIRWRPSIHMPRLAARIWLRVTDVRAERLQEITEEQAIMEGIIRLYDDLSDAEYIDWTKRTSLYPKAKEDWGYKNYLWHGNFGIHGAGNKLSDAWECQYSSYDSARDSFSSLWNTTVPLEDWNIYGWDANPWVWVIEFERCEKL